MIQKQILLWMRSGLNDFQILQKILSSKSLTDEYRRTYSFNNFEEWEELLDNVTTIRSPKNHRKRIHAINRLVKTRDITLVPLMRELLIEDKSETIRLNAAEFLTNTSFRIYPHLTPFIDRKGINRDIIETLILAIEAEEEISPLSRAIKSLGTFGGKPVEELLIALLDYEGEESWQIRQVALSALAGYTEEPVYSESLEKIAEAIINSREGTNLDISDEIWEAYENSPLSTSTYRYKELGRGDITPYVIKMLSPREDMDVLFTALNIARELKDERFIPVLERAIYYYREDGPNDNGEMVEWFEHALNEIRRMSFFFKD